MYGGSSVYRGMTCPNSTRRTVHGRSRAMTLDRAVVPGDREFVSENDESFPQAGPIAEVYSMLPKHDGYSRHRVSLVPIKLPDVRN